MRYLVDTNVLLRWPRPSDPLYAIARQAVERLLADGHDLQVSPQNLVEFWNVATRPADRNGFGMSPAQADAELSGLERVFLLAPDDARVYPEWRRLVTTHAVSGVQVHDARLVALMSVHGLTHILTFNAQDFGRYAGIAAVHPQDVAGAP